MTGKRLRLKRFFYPGSRYGLIVPVDHGLTLGPIDGIRSVGEMARWIRHPAIRGVIAHKGIALRLAEARLLDGLGLMVHLNGMSALGPSPDTKERLTQVETALRLGADGVSLQVNFDGHNDAANLKLMGQVVDEAERFGLPVLAMVYDKVPAEPGKGLLRQRHLMRIAVELGCDALKIAVPEGMETLPRLLDGIHEDIPVFLAGGQVTAGESLLAWTRAALRAGAAGLCVGRNVFQRNDHETVLTEIGALLEPGGARIFEAAVSREGTYGAH